MKTTISKLFAATLVWLVLSVSVQASTLYFSAPQGTGTQYVQQVGVDSDNPTFASGISSPASPANYVAMLYFSGFGTQLFEASIDTNVSAGTYYVGSFPWGADVYITIY